MQSNKLSDPAYHVHTVAISVANLEKSMEWYNENLGFQLMQRRDFPESQIFTAILGGVGFQLELIQNSGSKPISQFLDDPAQPTLIQGFKKVVIQTQQLSQLCDALEQSDVTFVYPGIQETPGVWGKWIMIEDLDGNVFQFIEAG